MLHAELEERRRAALLGGALEEPGGGRPVERHANTLRVKHPESYPSVGGSLIGSFA
jgi:hypothetical protein